MAQKRSTGHYIWATSLPRLLTGENSCEWVGWLRSTTPRRKILFGRLDLILQRSVRSFEHVSIQCSVREGTLASTACVHRGRSAIYPGLPRWTEAKIGNHVIAVNNLPMLRLS